MENWKFVVGYEGYYEVSDFGRVRSIGRKIKCSRGMRFVDGRVLSIHKNKRRSNYCSVVLSVDQRKERLYIHRMVLDAFVGVNPDGMQGCHFDGDPTNNYLDNLRWDTPKANNADKLMHGTDIRGEKSSAAKITSDNVIQIRARSHSEFHKTIADDYDISRQQVDRIVRGERWAHLCAPACPISFGEKVA